MRAVVQRVSQASVTVDGEVVGALDIGADEHGLVVLVGVTHDDTADDAAKLADKIWRLRILPGPDRELSAADVGAPILVISQFTLYANTARADARRGTPPPPGPIAEPSSTPSSTRYGRSGPLSPPDASAPTCTCRWSTTARSPSSWTPIRADTALA